MINQQNRPPTQPRLNGTHHASSTGTHNNNVKFPHGFGPRWTAQTKQEKIVFFDLQVLQSRRK
jgi:hypothetical protein